jgi:hypothetical protein
MGVNFKFCNKSEQTRKIYLQEEERGRHNARISCFLYKITARFHATLVRGRIIKMRNAANCFSHVVEVADGPDTFMAILWP